MTTDEIIESLQEQSGTEFAVPATQEDLQLEWDIISEKLDDALDAQSVLREDMGTEVQKYERQRNAIAREAEELGFKINQY